MMNLKFINAQGTALDLKNNAFFDLINVDGQTVANADISSTVVGGIDGDSINNIQAQPRTIVLDLRIKNGANVEDAKRYILNIIKLKRKCSLRWEQNNAEKVIEGVVENVEMPRWQNSISMQVTIHCEQPFWEDVIALLQEVNEARGLHYFTATDGDMLYFVDEGIPLGEYDLSRSRVLNNTGDVSVGMQIEILAYKTVTNPIIYDQYGNFFGVGYGTGNKQFVMQAGDKVVISTVKGNKTVKLNDSTNLFGYIKPQSTWLQLEAGMNTFAINSDDDDLTNMAFALTYKRRYI